MKAAKKKHLSVQAKVLADPNCSSSKWWRVAKKMCGLKANPCQSIPPLVRSSADLVSDDSQKADLLNEMFINQNTSLDQSAFPIGPSNTKSTFTFKEISADEVRKAIRSLPSKNSNVPDKISYRLLIKEAGLNVVWPLTTSFNLSLKFRQVPDEWQKAIVVPIFKGGHRQRAEPSNYRPVSLTSCVARLKENCTPKS